VPPPHFQIRSDATEKRPEVRHVSIFQTRFNTIDE